MNGTTILKHIINHFHTTTTTILRLRSGIVRVGINKQHLTVIFKKPNLMYVPRGPMFRSALMLQANKNTFLGFLNRSLFNVVVNQ